MSQVEQLLKDAAEKALIKYLAAGSWLLPNYESRFVVPKEWVTECWKMVDHDKVKQQVATLIETELAEKMVNSIAAELSTDIKQILGVKERREMIRGLARDHMEAIMRAGQ